MTSRYESLKRVIKEHLKEKLERLQIKDFSVLPYSDAILINPKGKREKLMRFKSFPDISKHLNELKEIEIHQSEIAG